MTVNFKSLVVGSKVILKPKGNRYMVDKVHSNGYLDLRSVSTGRCMSEHPETLAARFKKAELV